MIQLLIRVYRVENNAGCYFECFVGIVTRPSVCSVMLEWCKYSIFIFDYNTNRLYIHVIYLSTLLGKYEKVWLSF